MSKPLLPRNILRPRGQQMISSFAFLVVALGVDVGAAGVVHQMDQVPLIHQMNNHQMSHQQMQMNHQQSVPASVHVSMGGVAHYNFGAVEPLPSRVVGTDTELEPKATSAGRSVAAPRLDHRLSGAGGGGITGRMFLGARPSTDSSSPNLAPEAAHGALGRVKSLSHDEELDLLSEFQNHYCSVGDREERLEALRKHDYNYEKAAAEVRDAFESRIAAPVLPVLLGVSKLRGGPQAYQKGGA